MQRREAVVLDGAEAHPLARHEQLRDRRRARLRGIVQRPAPTLILLGRFRVFILLGVRS